MTASRVTILSGGVLLRYATIDSRVYKTHRPSDHVSNQGHSSADMTSSLVSISYLLNKLCSFS